VNHDLAAAAFVPDDLAGPIDRGMLRVVMRAHPLATRRDNVPSAMLRGDDMPIALLTHAFLPAIELVFDSTRHRNRRSLEGLGVVLLDRRS
jgi:hypothetical protein